MYTYDFFLLGARRIIKNMRKLSRFREMKQENCKYFVCIYSLEVSDSNVSGKQSS